MNLKFVCFGPGHIFTFKLLRPLCNGKQMWTLKIQLVASSDACLKLAVRMQNSKPTFLSGWPGRKGETVKLKQQAGHFPSPGPCVSLSPRFKPSLLSPICLKSKHYTRHGHSDPGEGTSSSIWTWQFSLTLQRVSGKCEKPYNFCNRKACLLYPWEAVAHWVPWETDSERVFNMEHVYWGGPLGSTPVEEGREEGREQERAGSRKGEGKGKL